MFLKSKRFDPFVPDTLRQMYYKANRPHFRFSVFFYRPRDVNE